MSHQAARVLLRTEPEQQASVTARFQKHQAATRSQILPPAALPDIENAHKCRILILQMPRTMPFKEVRDILRPFCTTNCIWDMCWLDSTRLQIIIDDHEVQTILRPATLPRTENSSMMLSKHQGKLLCNMRQNWRKIFFDQTPHGAALPRVKKRPSQVGVTGVQPEKEKSTNQLTPCVSEDPTSSEEHGVTWMNPTQNLIWMDPMSRYTLSTTHPTPAAQLTPDCPVSDFSGLSVLPDTSLNPIHSPTIPENFENFHFFHDFDPPGMVSDDSESMFHPAPSHGPGKRGIALGFLAVLPAREIEGVPGTLILAKVLVSRSNRCGLLGPYTWAKPTSSHSQASGRH
ncbi:hypothetical protein BASA83_013456 [Batrachochytrium salamandrivorans]|nr:hypothetical protein BASA83_013456 [Batrachochytrium salamandrivorans]